MPGSRRSAPMHRLNAILGSIVSHASSSRCAWSRHSAHRYPVPPSRMRTPYGIWRTHSSRPALRRRRSLASQPPARAETAARRLLPLRRCSRRSSGTRRIRLNARTSCWWIAKRVPSPLRSALCVPRPSRWLPGLVQRRRSPRRHRRDHVADGTRVLCRVLRRALRAGCTSAALSSSPPEPDRNSPAQGRRNSCELRGPRSHHVRSRQAAGSPAALVEHEARDDRHGRGDLRAPSDILRAVRGPRATRHSCSTPPAAPASRRASC